MMEGKRFKLPHSINIDQLESYLKERRCLVVSFFGKTGYQTKGNKGLMIDEVTGRSCFQNDHPESVPDKGSEIEAVFDPDRDVVFLHMRSCFDAYVAASLCKKAEDELQQKGFLSFWSNQRYRHARELIFLFQVSHILVCCHPGYSFDVSYIHLFKSLDNLRNNLQASVANLLKELPIELPKDWVLNGRPCPPRVLFLFQSAPASLRGPRGNRDERKEAKHHRHPPIKRLEISLEDQIYRILRKTRIITNISTNSLFAIPINQEFVYVDTGEQGCLNDPSATFFDAFFSLITRDVPEPLKVSGPFYHQHQTEELRKPTRSFAKFLINHINYGFEKGFFDNLSKYGPPPSQILWEIPLLSEWLVVANSLYTFFTSTLTTQSGKENSASMCELVDDMETETMFSELRCKKILPMALAAYEENLPPHYTEEYHNAKLMQAISVYSMQARGPASEKYAEKLAAQCQEHWQSGRMRCEELSLTGNNCMNRRHMLPGVESLSDIKTGKKILPTMQHTSGVQYIAACNCGRKQANREDPFTLCEANNTFYQDLEEDCCKDLEHAQFPVYQNVKINSSVSQAKILLDEIKDSEPGSEFSFDQSDTKIAAAETNGPEDGLEIEAMDEDNGPEPTVISKEPEIKKKIKINLKGKDVSGASTTDRKSSEEENDDTEEEAETGHQVTCTLAKTTDKSSLIKAGDTSITTRVSDTPTNEDETEIILEVLENMHLDGGATTTPNKVETLLSRAGSQIEYLTHMKTINSPHGLKPEYTSWSLVMIGSSHVYSHSWGLNTQPGFISSAKFLLPWEVILNKKTTSNLSPLKWSSVLENAAKRANVRSVDELANEKIVVKAFLGFEYECPKGHRFMVCDSDVPMKSSSVTREAASRLVSSDLPLYMACPCKSSSSLVAQMMRIHVVTPKAPVHITLFPQVQPTPGGPIFVAGWDTPYRLPINSYWVMRLPYIYWGEGGAHLRPHNPPDNRHHNGVLLKGCIQVDENYNDD